MLAVHYDDRQWQQIVADQLEDTAQDGVMILRGKNEPWEKTGSVLREYQKEPARKTPMCVEWSVPCEAKRCSAPWTMLARCSLAEMRSQRLVQLH